MNFPRDELLALVLNLPDISASAYRHTSPLYRALGMSEPCSERETQDEGRGHFKPPLKLGTGTGYNLACTEAPPFFVASGGIATSKINVSKELGHAGLDWCYWCYLWSAEFANYYLRPRYASTSEASPWSFWCKCRRFSRCWRKEKSASGGFWRMILSA